MTWTLALQLANVLVVPIVGWFMRNALGRYTDRLEAVEKQQAQMHAEQVELREQVATKVSEEEWLREIMRLRNQVDRHGETLAKIDGKMDSTLQVALAVNRLASAVEQNQEAQRGG